MDLLYDHIEEQSFSPTDSDTPKPGIAASNTSSSSTDPNTSSTAPPQSPNLRDEVNSAFKAAASSPWGTTLGGWFTSARQQGQSFYNDLQKEATEASEQATKGFSSLREQVVQKTRSLSIGNAGPGPEGLVPGEEGVPVVREGGESVGAAAEAEALQKDGAEGERSEDLTKDIVKEAGTLVASLRSTAASRLKDLQKAEDAADEALLKFGTNIRNFLRDAVVISAPDSDKEAETEVLFETQEPGGKKVFHSSRLEAQLHAIHTTATSFTQDPSEGGEWNSWVEEFDIDKKTDDIAKDLERYIELRRAMEKLVPEKVEYAAFWRRYYFLRKAVEAEEARRKEVLKGAANDTEEEVAWDDEDEEEATHTPNAVKSSHAASASTTTLTQPTTGGLKPTASPRRSHEDDKSVEDSDASYDMVSGATSRATGSPKEEKKDAKDGDDSDDDWE